MKNKEKRFDAVRMMREIRDRLSEQYSENPESEKKDLELIREKYGIQVQAKRSIHNLSDKSARNRMPRG